MLLIVPPAIQEFDIQRAHVLWLTGNPDKSGRPRARVMLAPGVEFWHTPNGGQRRDAFEGKRLREMGVQAGIHDIFYLRPTQFSEGVFGLLFGQEFKRPGGVLSPAQQKMHPRLLRAGLAASCVVDNLQAAREFCWEHRLAIPA